MTAMRLYFKFLFPSVIGDFILVGKMAFSRGFANFWAQISIKNR